MCSSFEFNGNLLIFEVDKVLPTVREEIQLNFFVLVSAGGPSGCFLALKLTKFRNDAFVVEELDEGIEGLILVGDVNVVIHQDKRYNSTMMNIIYINEF